MTAFPYLYFTDSLCRSPV